MYKRQNQIKDKGGNATGITVADSTANISIGTTLAVNTINEVTSANGVTIDGLSLKDGNVVPANGKGIDFSAQTVASASGATADTSAGAENLDHYETGSWTATITTTGTGFSFSGSRGTHGTYIRIGDMVIATCSPSIPTPTSGTGDVVVTGLPFASKSNTYTVGAVKWGRVSSLVIGDYISYIIGGQSQIQFYLNNNGSTNTLLPASAMNGNATPFLDTTLIYQTT